MLFDFTFTSNIEDLVSMFKNKTSQIPMIQFTIQTLFISMNFVANDII